jgi:uncharacterized membrane protein YiaA
MSPMTPNAFAWLISLAGAAIFLVGLVILGTWLRDRGN